MKNKNLVYITYSTDIEALNVASSLTSETLRSLGFHVRVVRVTGNILRFAGEFRMLLHSLHAVQYLYVTVDGRGALDKFSLLKLFKPSIQLIWEIHGHTKEPLWQTHAYKIRFLCLYRSLQRNILALLVHASISTTRTLAHYAHKELKIPYSVVQPSYVNLGTIRKQMIMHSGAKNIYFSKNLDKNVFIIFWGGGSSLRWQALDILENVARYTYKRDKRILFIVAGSNMWHNFSFQKNIIFYPSVPYEEYFHYIRQADVCLALYHDRSREITGLPFYYSPRKIIEYMSCRKVVIATKIRELQTIVHHGINGFVSSNTPEEIYSHIHYLKTHQKIGKIIGEEAYQTIQHTYTTVQAKHVMKSVFTYLQKIPVDA
jgi:glycosyltransferase involved in cell wall biosynthesis